MPDRRSGLLSATKRSREGGRVGVADPVSVERLAGLVREAGSVVAPRLRFGAAVWVLLLDIACSERVRVAGCRLIDSTPVRT